MFCILYELFKLISKKLPYTKEDSNFILKNTKRKVQEEEETIPMIAINKFQ